MSNDNTAPESACECKHEGLECGFCGTDITATIRALEAKVREVERERHDTNNEFAKVLADRDRLDLECARLTVDRGRLAAEVDRQVALCEQHRAAGIKSAAENARLAAEVERLQARRALVLMALCVGLVGCYDEPSLQELHARQTERRALFVQCMQLAAQSSRQEDDDVADIVDSCDNAAYYQSRQSAPPTGERRGER